MSNGVNSAADDDQSSKLEPLSDQILYAVQEVGKVRGIQCSEQSPQGNAVYVSGNKQNRSSNDQLGHGNQGKSVIH